MQQNVYKKIKVFKKNVDIYHHNIHVCILHEHLKLAMIYDLIIPSIYCTSLPKILCTGIKL